MRPWVIGHRGARRHFPENTIEGFRAAIAQGVRHFEIDVAMTRDGVVVLSHDQRLNPAITRDRGGAWLGRATPFIADMSYDALLEFDVGRIRPGTAYHGAFPAQQGVDNARIPTLDAVLRLGDGLHWMIEVKTAPNRPRHTAAPDRIADAVVATARAAGSLPRVVLQSFDWRVMRHLRHHPEVRCAWLSCPATRAWRGGQRRLPHTVAAAGGDTWAPRHTELTWRRFETARHLGLRVVPWTVNDPADARRLAAWGVDGLITDDPVAMRAWLPA